MGKKIKYSIIIPCYKTENTVLETLKSVSQQCHSNWEAIIVNDGSPDNLESVVLNYIKDDDRFKYFKKENGGLASARNYGIDKSMGDFILPLDSDNKLRPEFLFWANQIIEKYPEVNVIYGNAQRFGENDSFWDVGEFDKFKLLAGNYIDACAIIKKNIFNKFGKYDENMPHQGLEDWELWLRFSNNEVNFYYLNKITFDYRVSHNSMIRSFDVDMQNASREYIVTKYSQMYYNNYKTIFKQNKTFKKKINRLKDHPFYKLYEIIKRFKQ